MKNKKSWNHSVLSDLAASVCRALRRRSAPRREHFASQFCRMNCPMFFWPFSAGERGGGWLPERIAGEAIANARRRRGRANPAAGSCRAATGESRSGLTQWHL